MTPNKYLKATVALLICAVIIVACTTPQVVENPPGSGNLTTNHIVDPRLTTGLEIGRVVNDATSGVNPFHGLVTILLGATSAVAGWVATRKNGQLTTANKVLTTVIQGVNQANNGEVKTIIQAHASKVGVEGVLSQAVAKVDNGQTL